MEAIVYIFSRKMEATEFIILQILLATRAVLKIGEYHSDIHILQFYVENIQSCEHLGQSRAKENT